MVQERGSSGAGKPAGTGGSTTMDQLHPSLINQQTGVLDTVRNLFFGLVPTGVMSNPNVQRGQLLTPFPHIPSVGFAATSWGNSNFHSLQARFERRLSAGTTIVAAYTWSKLISDGGDNAWASSGFRNFYCRACERSISPYDFRHRLVTSFTYELPFGRGKKFGASWNRLADGVLGGWQMNGILTFNSGLPLQISTTGNTSFSFGGGQRPDSTGQSAHLDNPTLAQWFNTSTFRLPAQYTSGNVGRMHPSLRSDFSENLDFSVFKRVRIVERVQMELRGEWFNAPNHPIFGEPNATVGNAQFGRVTSTANGPRQTQLALKLLF